MNNNSSNMTPVLFYIYYSPMALQLIPSQKNQMFEYFFVVATDKWRNHTNFKSG